MELSDCWKESARGGELIDETEHPNTSLNE